MIFIPPLARTREGKCHITLFTSDLSGNNRFHHIGRVQINDFKYFIRTLIQLKSENEKIHSCLSVSRLNNKKNYNGFGKADGNSRLELIAMHIITKEKRQ